MGYDSAWQDLRWRVGLWVFAVLVGVGSACAAWTLHGLRASGERAANQDVQAIAQSIAQTLAQQLGRAVRLGIPLDELPGVPPYLEATLKRQPVLSALAVEQADGTPLHFVGQALALAPARGTVRVPIVAGAAHAGFVVAGTKSTAPLQGSQGQALWISAVAVLGIALAVALWAALRPGARLEVQRRAVLARLQQGRSDGLPPPEGRGHADGLQLVLDTLAQGDDEQRAAHAALQAYAHELLSVDFDGHMRAGIERIVRQCAQDELK